MRLLDNTIFMVMFGKTVKTIRQLTYLATVKSKTLKTRPRAIHSETLGH